MPTYAEYMNNGKYDVAELQKLIKTASAYGESNPSAYTKLADYLNNYNGAYKDDMYSFISAAVEPLKDAGWSGAKVNAVINGVGKQTPYLLQYQATERNNSLAKSAEEASNAGVAQAYGSNVTAPIYEGFWSKFDTDGDHILSGAEADAYHDYVAANDAYILSQDYTPKNSSSNTLLDKIGETVAQPVLDIIDVGKGVVSTAKTGDVSDTTDAVAKASGHGAVANTNTFSDYADKVSNGTETAINVATGGTNSATQAAFDTAACVNYLTKGDWKKAAEELAKAGVSVDEAILGSGTVDINYLIDELNKSNTGESNGAGTVGFTQNVINALGAAVTGNNNFNLANTSQLEKGAQAAAEGTNKALKAAEEKAKQLYESATGGSGDGSGSDWFSNYSKVNDIVQNGSQSALDQYESNNAAALAPITEAKDAYNYKTQLDNFNEFNNNYNLNMQQYQADLEGNKNAAENWQTYMNPLTEYLNQQLAENAKGSAGSMLNSSATQNSINKAIADNTAAQYQNAVNTAMNQATQNASLTQQQATNLNSMMNNEQQRLENNVTPTTDWTSFMTDAADTQYNNQMNVVNTQAGIAAQQPTTAETWADLLKTGASVVGAIGSIV